MDAGKELVMAACDNKDWRIRLKIDGDEPEEAVFFTDIGITNGIVVGKVRDGDGRVMSVLRGLCRPSTSAGHVDMSHLEFIFYVRDIRREVVMLRLEGVGY